MKILLLADLKSIHTVRWINALFQLGYEVEVASCHIANEPLPPEVCIHSLRLGIPFCFYLAAFQLRSILKRVKPDLMHAHYASGYGTLARLSNYHPYVLSVWGSDVYEFPFRSNWHKRVMRKNLESADYVCSTSYAMAEHTLQLGARISHLQVIPFGIDTVMFSPSKCLDQNADITIGTVKTLSDRYGIDILIRAFARARDLVKNQDRYSAQLMRLLIVGDGDKRTELYALARELGLEGVTEFAGFVSHDQVPDFLNKLDVYIALSRSESFGVAILEASATALPVIVSDVGGLPEVVEGGVTGFIVKSEDIEGAALAITKLALDSKLRKQLGNSGRKHVLEHYEWGSNVQQMAEAYKEVLMNGAVGK